jgi:NAD(P)-dependent dehydrogenase (short-subunit alcohol dehydrogenase family)
MALTIDLSGQAALVTGAGAGIGAEIARWLAHAGAAVAVNDMRPERADAVVDAIDREGGRAIAAVADCRNDDEIATMVARTVDALGGLDIAVNNIGMLGGYPAGPLTELDGDTWRGILDQNVVLTALCARAEARTMVAQERGGVIINVSSGETTRPAPYLSPYAAAKAAINHLTQTMAVELGPAGIRVIAIAPGTTLTETVRFDEDHVAAIVASNPLRRMTEADELARLTVFLASEHARCITGQLILADAGAHLSRSRPPAVAPSVSAQPPYRA